MAERIGLPNVNFPILPDEPIRGVDNKVTTIIAQMLAAGTATAGEIQLDIGINTEDTIFGAGSHAAEMVRKFREVNKISQVNVIGLDDAAGTAATRPIVFAGTATAAGTYDIYVGYKETVHLARIPVAIDDDETAIGDAFEAAQNALTKSMMTAANVAGTVTLTAKNKGTVSNTITIIIEGTVAGVTATIGALTDGATDPTATSLETEMQFQTDIALPYELGIADLQTFLDDRFNTNNNILNGTLFTGVIDTKANVVIIGDAENSQSTNIIADKPVALSGKVGNAFAEMPQNLAVVAAATRALRLEDNSDISDIITSREPNDNIGGVHMAGLPYFNTVLPLNVIPINQGWTAEEVADLNTAGVYVAGNNDARNGVILGELLTTYKTDGTGLDDDTYRTQNNYDTSTSARAYMFRSLKIDYAQARLQVGNRKLTGYKVATEPGIIADMMKYYASLSNAPLVLFQGGDIGGTGETVGDKFRDALTVVIDTREGSFTVSGILPIMSQTRLINAPFSIKLDVTK